MADVYCAEDAQLGRRVALKVLHRRFAEDQEFVERFRREASAAAGLQHPNVVQVFDRGEIEGTYYIAMEFLEGRSLKQLVRDEGPLDPARAIDITIQVLRAARFAHKRGIIHRDIKPHNVIVDAEDRVKVTDFGIARAGASDMTETGAIMGTAAYLSPEQAQGHTVSASSDLYSIGILLYELLTGNPPFDAESAVSIALKQVSETPVPPRAVNPAVSPELEDVVLRALQKDPARRFGDADEFTAALEAVRELPARPDLAQRTGDLTGVYPALGVYEEDPRERRGWRFWTMLLLIVLALAAIGVGLYLLLRPTEVAVPKVVGQTSEVASARLNNLGFEVSLQQLPNRDVPEGVVARQRPNPGERADKGSIVTIFVSSGPGQADVPDVVGSSVKAARKALEKAGFKSEVETEFSETVAKGKVIDTRPAARTHIDLGQTVTLIVSKGPEQAAVPDVVGLPEAEATAQLQDAGFEVATRRVESTTADPGDVTAQDPAGGEELRKGETVTLTLAKRPAEVEVPDVRGESLDEALTELSNAGLRVRRRVRTVSSPDEDGVVLDQQPASGKLRRGSTVLIVVGAFDDSQLNPEPDDTPTPSATTTPDASATP
ncbi:MAG: eukaryotic-like serine/threonine-protein kinase [Solirubrobacteraceae bacterium]|nr:eukaryotic-like serine/threonine-protein kinase [Solirubrobacteraceae bacterium]